MSFWSAWLVIGLLALIIWVGGAALFYVFEKDNPVNADNFNSIPNAMYMVAIFLGGEWAACDFTVPGKILCCIFCIIAIAIFALPIGFLFDAFQDELGGQDEEEEEDAGENSVEKADV